jgi:hypothetical protein
VATINGTVTQFGKLGLSYLVKVVHEKGGEMFDKNVSTSVTMKSVSFWVVKSCNSVKSINVSDGRIAFIFRVEE